MNPILAQPCPHCRASVGTRCTVPATGKPLTLSQAHPSRLESVGLASDTQAVDRFRELWNETC